MKAKKEIQNKKITKHVARKGVHAKTKSSKIKSSKLYLKRYKGQGR